MTISKPAFPQLQRGHPLVGGLVMALTLHEADGTTVNDLSGRRNNGTLTNAPARTGGQFGRALSFNAAVSNQYIATNVTIASGAPFSYSIWIKPNTPTQDYGNVGAHGGDVGFWLRGSAAGANNLKMTWFTGTDHLSSVALTDQAWNHYLAVSTGANIQHYINGAAAGSSAYTAIALNMLNIGNDGTFGGGANEPFKGTLDAPMLWNRALSSQEVKMLYHDSFIMFRRHRSRRPII